MNNPYLILASQIDRKTLSKSVYEAAKRHHYGLGHNVIPLYEFGKNDGGIYREEGEEIKKRLRVAWKSFVNNRMTDEEFENLFSDRRNYKSGATRYHPTGLAVVLGPVSDVLALDFDTYTSESEVKIPDMLRSPLMDRTPNGGVHAYFRRDESLQDLSASLSKAKTFLNIPHNDEYFAVEMLINQLVLVSPSMVLSKNGQFIGSYQYTKGVLEDFAKLPTLTVEQIKPYLKYREIHKSAYLGGLIKNHDKIRATEVFKNPELLPKYLEDWHSEFINLTEGESRHDSLLKLANSLVYYGFSDQLILSAFEYAQSKYPHKDRQINAMETGMIIEDARNYIGEKRHQYKTDDSAEKDKRKDSSTPNKTEKAVQLALEEGLIVFLDEDQKVRVVMPDKPVAAHLADSQEFVLWIRGLIYKKEKEALAESTLKTIIGTLMGYAAGREEYFKTYLRTAYIDGKLYYDIGNGTQLVVIDSKGWDVKSYLNKKPPVYFLYSPLLKEQQLPAESGNIEEVLDFINVSDKKSRIEYLTILVCWLFPHIPRPVLAAVGPKGSAKSTSVRIIKMLTDPSRVPLINSPKDLRELAILTSQQSVVALDNLSSIPQYLSDYIAMSVTGGGYLARELYTNSGLVVFDRRAAFAITSITAVVDRSDLLNRSVIVEHREIPEDKRLEEAELLDKFNSATPRILAGIFTVVSDTLKILPDIKLARPPRMADYAKHAAAAWVSMGGSVEEYEQVIRDNYRIQNETVIESSATAQALIDLTSAWQSGFKKAYKPSELFEELKNLASHDGSRFTYGFPNAVNKLNNYILPIKENLRSAGILIYRGERTSESRGAWVIEKFQAVTGNDASDANDDPFKLEKKDKSKTPVDKQKNESFKNRKLPSVASAVINSHPDYDMPEIPQPGEITDPDKIQQYRQKLSAWLGEFSGNSRLSENFNLGMNLQKELTKREFELLTKRKGGK